MQKAFFSLVADSTTKTLLAVALTMVCQFFTTVKELYTVLGLITMGAVFLDFLAGLALAWKKGQVVAKKARQTAWKTTAYFIPVSMLVLLGTVKPVFDELLPFLYWYIIGTECLSLVEKSDGLGFTIPPFVVQAFESLRERRPDERRPEGEKSQ